MLVESKKTAVLSREFKVLDIDHGLYGYIDEIWMTPDNFVVIDDKPGTKSYSSSINQVFGYCLAFKAMATTGDTRKVTAALRERGTENIFWQSPFGETEEEGTITLVNHIHSLLVGKEEFLRTSNPNKCKVCRLKRACGIDQ
jgi:CRISPR-associated exonuclease Cas4